jgi:hypothetical protein
MPVLESTDGGTPRSALRYRSLDETNNHRSVVTTAAHPVIQRASRARPRPADDDLISEWKRGDTAEPERITHPPRSTASQRKISPPAGRANNSAKQPASTHAPVTTQPRQRAHIHPLLSLGLGMLGMLALWTLLTAGLGWWNDTLDFLHYGNPRTYQTNAVVGHNDSTNKPSHFIALNLHGHIEIIEFPGGDGAHAHIYLGPQLFGSDAEKAPATLKFIDVNGDKKQDMLVFFQSSWIVFINDQGTFRPPTVDEQQDAARYLAAHPQS